MTRLRLALAPVFTAALAACGGDVGDATFGGHRGSDTPVTTAASGLYVGYYQEDATSDPADPVAGALVLNLPAASGSAITGSINYNGQPCQTANALPLGGTRSDLGVTGTFAGTIDARAETGTFSATLDTTALNFSGTYAVDGGAQSMPAVTSCVAYTLAGLGKIELFPVAKAYPSSNFGVTYTVASRTIGWSAITGMARALVYIVDGNVATSATGSASPVPWQTVVDPAASTLSVVVPSTVTLASNRPYYAVVELADAGRTRIAFSSTPFTAP